MPVSAQLGLPDFGFGYQIGWFTLSETEFWQYAAASYIRVLGEVMTLNSGIPALDPSRQIEEGGAGPIRAFK